MEKTREGYERAFSWGQSPGVPPCLHRSKTTSHREDARAVRSTSLLCPDHHPRKRPPTGGAKRDLQRILHRGTRAGSFRPAPASHGTPERSGPSQSSPAHFPANPRFRAQSGWTDWKCSGNYCDAAFALLTVRFDVSEPRLDPPAAFFLSAQRFCAAARIFALVASDILRRPLRFRGVSASGIPSMRAAGRPRFARPDDAISPNSAIRTLALSRTVPKARSNVWR